jgi:chemosensory pili system protein ChpB (putative protein-glutamate methylesterase)
VDAREVPRDFAHHEPTPAFDTDVLQGAASTFDVHAADDAPSTLDADVRTPAFDLDLPDVEMPTFDTDVRAFAPAVDMSGIDEATPAFDTDAHELSLAFDMGVPGEAPPTFDIDGLDAAAPAFDTDVPHEAASMFDPVLAEFDTYDGPATPFLGELLPEPQAATPPDNVVVQGRFRQDLDDLHLRIADMQLENTRLPRSTPLGAVIVLAGIGGPDAVRQLLGALPATFPRPVLIQQRLEGGRHDKLVRQMQRATAMPVALAESGLDILGGHVYMLPAGLGLAAGSSGLKFRSAADEPVADALFAQLSPADSAVVLLSGSDPAAVDAAMNHSVHGALVVGQSAEGCFDSAAADALVARGASAGTPAQLAQKLAARWPPDANRDTH